MSQKHITLVLPDLAGGGAERVAVTLTQWLIGRGHEVDLLLCRNEGELLPLVPPQARIIDLSAPRLRNALRPLIRYLRNERPDAVQAFMWPLTIVATIAHRLSRSEARLVLSDHSTLSRQYGGSRKAMTLLRTSVRLVYPLADARIAVSDGSADDLARLSGIDRRSISVVYNPIQQLPPSPVRASWSADGKRILTVGALKPEKDQALLIRAFAIMAAQEPASLLVLGEGQERAELTKLVEHLGLTDRVAIPGFVLHPEPFYAAADLFILSSRFEGYPLVLAEAMMAGVPVVSTDCQSGPREILDGGRFGKLVPVGDAEALAAAAMETLRNPLPAEMLRRRAEELTAGVFETYERLMLGPLTN